MKKHRQHNTPRKRNNQGFSLVELIISIAILAIVMIPLMSSFYRSMQMNKKAEELQVQTNLAANIMEGIKSLTIMEIIEQFNGFEGAFQIVSNASGYPEDVMRLEMIGGQLEETMSEREQSPYYFAIHGIVEGGTAYDALITMDPSQYYNASNIMNDYPMPNIINLDQKVNGLLFSMGTMQTDTIDNDALTTFLQWGEAYARRLYENSSEYLTYLDEYDQWKDACEEAEMGGPTPSPEPTPPPFLSSDLRYQPYLDQTIVKSLITKTMLITVNAEADTITYQINYECIWTPNNIEKSIQYLVSETKYSKPIENIYFFYEPSIFKDSLTIHPDIIEIENQNTANPINLFVAEQESESSLLPHLTIARSSEDNVRTYTNLHASEVSVIIDEIEIVGEGRGITPGIVKTEKVDRIYDISIDICEYVNGEPKDKYKKILYTLESTKEQ